MEIASQTSKRVQETNRIMNTRQSEPSLRIGERVTGELNGIIVGFEECRPIVQPLGCVAKVRLRDCTMIKRVWR
jgi:hypothetical protein